MSNDEHRAAARLELVAGLRRSRSGWTPREWAWALWGLSPFATRVVLLRVLFRMRWDGIAERLDTSKATVRSVYWQSIGRLREFAPAGGF